MPVSTHSPATLANRAVIRLSPLDEGEEVADFLQGLVTNDVAGTFPMWAALLSPQGKVLFDFLIWEDPSTGSGRAGDLLLDCEAAAAAALVKRLSLYRLRRKIAIALDPALSVHWSSGEHPGALPDPRLSALGWRWLGEPGGEATDAAWLAHRLSLGVTEGQAELSDLLWLECNAAELNGVSFTKGCYVGQENTARMNWRAKVNRRLVVVPLTRSEPKRQRIAYPELGLAVDHLRVEDIPSDLAPEWLDLG